MQTLTPVTDSAWVTASDFPDPDVIRVDDTWYMISTTMYFLPGGVILRSYDLLHWEVCGHVFDRLDEVHHEMAPEALAATMEAEGYREILRESTDLPNGKKLMRMDFEKEE